MDNFCIPIMPFPDGNGRSGRLLVNLELMEAEYPPTEINLLMLEK